MIKIIRQLIPAHEEGADHRRLAHGSRKYG